MHTLTTPFLGACARAAALAGLTAFGHAAPAHVLDFGNSAARPFVACATPSGTCSNYSRLLQSYGDIPGVVDVTTHAADGGALQWWPTGYNDLYGVLFNNVASVAAPAWIDLVPLQAGQAVTLTHFEFGGYLGQRHDVAISVIDLGTGLALYSYLGDIGTGAAGGSGQHSSFDLSLSSTAGLRIQWADPAVAANTAIDNIVFEVGAPVPEPGPAALWLAGLGVLGFRAARGRCWPARRGTSPRR